MLASKKKNICDLSEGLTFICGVPGLVGTGPCTGIDTLSQSHRGYAKTLFVSGLINAAA